MNVQVSSNFKKMANKAIFSIVLFILVYILLIFSAIVLTSACVFLGITVIVAKPMFFTIVLGAGLVVIGFLVLFFLVKFLFKRNKFDTNHLVEIKRKDEPKLFQFLDEIVKEVKTDFPKKVYLSTEVNASVFYDSSFWSMFLPIRKNLHIGLGLVNTISNQEFKSILAHEFGHFSQKSMKVGSYVYQVNKIIHNLLYENESFDNIIRSFNNISSYLGVFIEIAIKIIQGIQWVLVKMYEIVNINHMALSREMEFHADEIAANVAGSLALKNALLRLSLSEYSLNSVLNFYDNKIGDNIKSTNIFKEHFHIMNFFANNNKVKFENNLPMVTIEELNKYNKSKLIIKDQWASHPSTEERTNALDKLNININDSNYENAMLIFNDSAKTQKLLTDKLFSTVKYEEKPYELEFELFKREFQDTFDKNSFPEIFNEYYNGNL